MKCEYLGIDIQDDMGRHEVGFVENTVKTPLGVEGEGCLFEARFFINKVRKFEYFQRLGVKTFSTCLRHFSPIKIFPCIPGPRKLPCFNT